MRYVPHGATGRHKTVVYGPSSLAVLLTSLDEFRLPIEFMLRAGWAVAMSVFEGTFHGGTGQRAPSPVATSLFRQVRAIRRVIDYLETRPDIDRDSFVFYGFGWGTVPEPVALTTEPRLRVGILIQAGLPHPGSGELHPINYLPRLQQSVLQFNGRYDTNFRYKDSARAFFEAPGSESKQHVVEPATHFAPNSVVIAETLAWLDQHLEETE